jgi:hypothetical protein
MCILLSLQRKGRIKNVTAATNTHATKELLDASLSMLSQRITSSQNFSSLNALQNREGAVNTGRGAAYKSVARYRYVRSSVCYATCGSFAASCNLQSAFSKHLG